MEVSFGGGWLEALLGEKFFNSCLLHESQKKNDDNTFCLDCCFSLCVHCLSSHTCHRLLKIRRYMYQDVLRLGDAEKIMDCSSIQPYITNNAKVLFLKPKPMRKQSKGSDSTCLTCERNLQDTHLFCSISCKVQSIVGSSSRKPTLNKLDCMVQDKLSQLTTNLNKKTMPPLSTSSDSSGSIEPMNFEIPSARSATNRRKNIPRRSPLL